MVSLEQAVSRIDTDPSQGGTEPATRRTLPMLSELAQSVEESTAKEVPMSKRVLVTGAGGPAAVAFMNALIDSEVELHAADIDPYAPGLYLVPAQNRHLIKRGSDRLFVNHLLALCTEHKIDALVPTVDAELLPIAQARHLFAARGVRVLAAAAETLGLCLDKWALHHACLSEVEVPRTQLLTDRSSWPGPFPCVVKPRTGSGSRGVMVVEDARSFDSIPRSDKLLVQEHLPGEEYSVDVYVGQSGGVHAAVPRVRLKVDSGVAITSRTLRDPDLIGRACQVAKLIGLRGVANIQFRRDRLGVARLLEVNPRFAGTMSLTVRSGANIPQMALSELFGSPPPAGMVPFEEIGMVRTFRETYVSPQEILSLVAQAQSPSRDPALGISYMDLC